MKAIWVDQNLAFILSEIFKYLLFISPLIAYLIVRKNQTRIIVKIAKGVLITTVLVVVFFIIAFFFWLQSGKIF